MRYTFANANAPSIKPPQYFEVLGSRGIYADGWIASVFGPRIPWKPGPLAALRDWNPENDIWSLYHVDKDFSEADDLAAAKPAKLAEMKSLFDRAAREDRKSKRLNSSH